MQNVNINYLICFAFGIFYCYFYFNIQFLAWVEVEDTYALAAVSTLQEAVNTILKFLALGAANMSERVNEGVHTHTLLCSGNSICLQIIFQFINS